MKKLKIPRGSWLSKTNSKDFATDGQTWVRINKTENSTSTTFLTFASRVVSAAWVSNVTSIVCLHDTRVCFRFWIHRCVRTTSYVKVAIRLSVCSARLSFRPNREEHVSSRFRSMFFIFQGSEFELNFLSNSKCVRICPNSKTKIVTSRFLDSVMWFLTDDCKAS